MSRKTTTLKALIITGAVTGAAFGVVPAQAATVTANQTTVRKAALGVPTVVGIVGTGFTDAISSVTFTATGSPACAATSLVVVSSTLLYAKTPPSGCSAGLQKVSLLNSTPSTLAELAATSAAKTVLFATPPTLSAVDPGIVVTTGGASATATVAIAVPATSSVQVTIGDRTVPGKANPLDRTKIFFKAPADTPGPADARVTVDGFTSAPLASALTYKLAVRVSPNVFTSGATAPYVKIEGSGFTPTTTARQYVSFCGVQAPVLTAAVAGTQVKAPTSTALWVQAPTFAAASAGTVDGKVSGASGADGGLCVVKVVVDPNGTDVLTTPATNLTAAAPSSPADGTADVDSTSVVTATSGFVYAAY